MNKKVALVILIRHSILLPDDSKLALLEQIQSMNDRQVDALGKFLATEREIALGSEQEIQAHVDEFVKELEINAQKGLQAVPQSANLDKVDQVYIGSGKP